MKFTKTQLKKLIKEQVEAQLENEENDNVWDPMNLCDEARELTEKARVLVNNALEGVGAGDIEIELSSEEKSVLTTILRSLKSAERLFEVLSMRQTKEQD